MEEPIVVAIADSSTQTAGAATVADHAFTATATNPEPGPQQVARNPATADQNRKFVGSVLVWPGSNEAPGWINMHVNSKNYDASKNGGKACVVRWPFKTLNEFFGRAVWADNHSNFFNVW